VWCHANRQDERYEASSQRRRLIHNTDRETMRRGREHSNGLRVPPHTGHASECSDGARRPEDATRRAINNVIGSSRSEQRVFIANLQPGDGAENHIA
jgi:hypothetical protein